MASPNVSQPIGHAGASNLSDGDGYLVYGGVQFLNSQTVSASAEPIYDSAGRTTIGVKHTLTVMAYIQATLINGLDGTMNTLHQILNRNGLCLVYKSKGYGSFQINADSEQPPINGVFVQGYDSNWGPKPRVLQWEPFGENQAAKITWRVEFQVPMCDNALYVQGIMAFNYRMTWGLDQGGYTRRTYTGKIQIPLTIATGGRGVLSDQADRLREVIVPAVPTGFRRDAQTYDLDEAKGTLSFTVNDVQMPSLNYPPPNFVNVNATHSVSAAGADAIACVRWTGSITAEYEVAAGQPKSQAYRAFAQLVQSRMDPAIKSGVTIIPNKWSFSEDIYGKSALRAEFGYFANMPTVKPGAAVGGVAGAAFIAAGGGGGGKVPGRRQYIGILGLWRQLDANDWTKWATSMQANAVWGPRGYAGLTFGTNEDVIVDLCAGLKAPGSVPGKENRIAGTAEEQVPPQPQGGGVTSSTISGIGTVFSGLVSSGGGGGGGGDGAPDLVLPPPTRSTSYIDYHMKVRVSPDDETAVMGLLPTQPIAQVPGQSGTGGYLAPYAPTVGSTIVQTRRAPTINVTFSGQALRAGFPVDCPAVVSIAGKPAVPVNRGDSEFFECQQVSDLFGIPIFAASWKMRFVLTDVPAQVLGPTANPLIGTTDQGAYALNGQAPAGSGGSDVTSGGGSVPQQPAGGSGGGFVPQQAVARGT